MNGRWLRFLVIATLYVSQAVPLGFMIVALPAILRSQGTGLEFIGLLSALSLPWLIKFLWAPLVDRWGAGRPGHYRRWILPLQLTTVSVVAALSAADPSAGGIPWLIAGGAIFMLASATQDIATDGLAVKVIPEDERGGANGLQVGGYYAGQVLGGGLLLVLFERAGWAAALLTMAALLAMPLLPLALYREPAATGGGAAPAKPVGMGAIRRFVTRPGSGAWIAILLLYRAGESMALQMFNPMLVDGGLSLATIGVTLGVASSLGACGGALLGGNAIRRLGRRTSLVAFGFLQSAALLLYLIPAAGNLTPSTVYAVACAVAAAGGMATAALYTHMMDRCDPQSGATDFTVQQSLCAVGPLFGVAASGFIASSIGYAGHFVICSILAAGVAVLVARRWTAELAAPLQGTT